MAPYQVGVVLILAIAPIALSAIAALNDVRAFTAVATPGLYCWLALCVVCTLGMLVSARTRPPLYFQGILLIGVLGGLLTLSTAWEVLTKNDASSEQPAMAEPSDLREKLIQDAIYANQDFRRTQFRGSVLSHVDLSGSNLAEADLRDVRFEDVDVSGVDLCGADLRGADLRGARSLDAVENWAYAYYDGDTRLPKGYDFTAIPGPIPDTGRGLLYMCTKNQTRRIDP
jgi:hypothetical protein